MKRLRRILLRVVLVLLAVALLFAGIRFVNGLRYPNPALPNPTPRDAASYQLNQAGTTITPISGTYLRGFHLVPATVSHKGIVFTWGGSDGGCDFEHATDLAKQGYEVIALFYFGQPGQREALQQVPLEFFGEALDYAKQHARSASPVTVLGTSRGAELALLLPTYYPQIDNVVVFTPSEYVWQGLDYGSGIVASTWTWQGTDVPFLPMTRASGDATRELILAMALNYLARLRPTFTTALAGDPSGLAAARIDLSKVRGHLLAFAGTDDQMWPGDDAARDLQVRRPHDTEAHVYEAAGHLFYLPGSWANGYLLGGTADANAAAKAASDGVLAERLAAWTA